MTVLALPGPSLPDWTFPRPALWRPSFWRPDRRTDLRDLPRDRPARAGHRTLAEVNRDLRELWTDPPPLQALGDDSKVHLPADPDLRFTGRPGMNYLVPRGSWLAREVQVSGTGTKDRPIVLRGHSDSTNPDDWPELVDPTGELFRGDHVVLWRLRLRNPCFTPRQGHWCRVGRCVLYGKPTVGDGAGVTAFILSDYATTTNTSKSIEHFRFDHNYVGTRGSDLWRSLVFLCKLPKVQSRTVPLGNYFKWFDVDHNDFNELRWCGAFIGDSAWNDLASHFHRFFANLVRGWRYEGTASALTWETKASDVEAFDNTWDATATGSRAQILRLRHGWRNDFYRNLFVGGGNIQLRGHEGETYENQCRTASGGPATGTVMLNNGRIDPDRWPEDSELLIHDGKKWAAPADTDVMANDMDVVVEAADSTSPLTALRCGIRPDTAGLTDRNRSVTGASRLTSPRTLGPTGRDFAIALPRLTPADVGVNAP